MTESELKEKMDDVLANGVYGWRNESELIKEDVLDQILTVARQARRETLMELAAWLDSYRYSLRSGWSLLTSDVAALHQGKMPK